MPLIEVPKLLPSGREEQLQAVADIAIFGTSKSDY
jgi:hypothetical protein